jgi:hypothetical protein
MRLKPCLLATARRDSPHRTPETNAPFDPSFVHETTQDPAMTFKPAIWYPIAVVLGVGNVVGVGFAAQAAEPWHAAVHAPDKWSIRQLLSHINDAERLFTFRAFWFARGFDTPLPSFDQDVAAGAAGADERSWQSHVAEFRAVREATLTLFRSLPSEAWDRRGIAGDNPFTVRVLAYIVVGHVTHHTKVLRQRYLP